MHRLTVVLVLFGLVIASTATDAVGGERQVVTTRDEMPRHAYPFTVKSAEILQSDTLMDALAHAVRTDIQADLANYDIQDAKTLRDRINGLVDIALLMHEDSLALTYLPQVADLQEKASARELSGLLPRCVIMAEKFHAKGHTPSKDSIFALCLRSALDGKDWNVIAQDVKEMKGHMEWVTRDFLVGLSGNDYDAVIENSGELNSEIALGLLYSAAVISRVLPYKETIVATLGDIIAEHTVEKDDIWPQREVNLMDSSNLSPVVIGIWDTGVDPDVYSDQMLRRTSETFDGKDDDGNGFIDDVYGIAFTFKGEPEPHVLLPIDPGEREAVLGFQQYLRGLLDLVAGIESDESQTVKRKINSLSPEDVPEFMENAWHYIMYVHGTHLTGIALAGNPAARITVARMSFPYQTVPPPLFVDDARRYAENFQMIVDYFKRENVRVVCMSWGYQAIDFERIFEKNGIGADQQERAAMAKEVFDTLLSGLQRAMESAPDILFLNAAGNNDNSVDFEADLPGSINLPNMLTIGAVDFAGDETAFTAYGESVDFYANGFMVPSKIPGGETIALSGTSMAEPQVGNLAGKLLAVDPDLSTTEVIDLIRAGAGPKEGGHVLLINPKRSLALLRHRLAARSKE